jgi:hypothetical protein
MKPKIGETQALTNALNSGHYTNPTYSELQNGYKRGGGSKTPTAPTIAECKPIGLNAITLNWDRQLNLTNFDHYEVQVSENQSNWYSLQNDGTDWKGTLGAVTEVSVELITHENIPAGGTEDNPTALTLYYRVRRTIKGGGDPGEWSTSASATTNLIESKYIKKDAVTTAKLIDEAVISAKIKGSTFFSNHFEDDDFDKWTEQTGSTITQDSDAREGAKAGLFSSTNNNPNSTGKTDEVYISIPEAIALHFAGRRIKISFEAKQPSTNPAAEAAVAYSTSDMGNSDWLTFAPTSSWQRFTFDYNVPEANSGGSDFLGIWGDTTGSGKGVLIDGLSIQLYVDDDSIITTMISDLAITTAKLAAASVIADKIATDAVTADKILAGAVAAGKIAAGAVDTNELAALAVTGAKIAANTITADQIDSNTLEVLFANIAYTLAVGYAGSGSYDNPQAGDTRTYIDGSTIKVQYYNGSSWDTRGTMQWGGGQGVFETKHGKPFAAGTTAAAVLKMEHDASNGILNNSGGQLLLQDRGVTYLEIGDNEVDFSGIVLGKIKRNGELSGLWVKIGDPGTGWLASKTDWSAGTDDFEDGLDVDFDAEVPSWCQAVRVVVYQTGTTGKVYYRRYHDFDVERYPDTNNEVSHLIMGLNEEYAQVVIWIDDYYDKAQFTVTNARTDLYISHVLEYLG